MDGLWGEKVGGGMGGWAASDGLVRPHGLLAETHDLLWRVKQEGGEGGGTGDRALLKGE